jgi:hypothetical protein
MLKYVLLATSMLIAAPAMAQDAKATDSTSAQAQTSPAEAVTPVQDQATSPAQATPPAAPVQTAPTPATQAAQPTPVAPAEGQVATQPAPTEPAAAQPAAPAATAQAPITSGDQIAQVVSKEFPTYDKDANGALDTTEFGNWMTALRKAADPAFQAGSPDAGKWVAQAFAQADTDKNSAINQGELTTFLTPKSS